MKIKNKNLIFVCQVAADSLKVLKWLPVDKAENKFVSLEVTALPDGEKAAVLAGKIKEAFERFGYSHNPVVLSLPRNLATCRYVRLPAQTDEEIDKMAPLQASNYLPYPASELITGYQAIEKDNLGYSHVNLVIAQKAVIQRYLSLFEALKPAKLSIIPGSYGISALYNRVGPKEQSTVMVVDIDSLHTELAILRRGKILFSRYFTHERSHDSWKSLFIEEIKKTREAYMREINRELPKKIVVLGTEKTEKKLTGLKNSILDIPLEFLNYTKKLNFSESFLQNILSSEDSFASLIGLSLEAPERSLSLLPQEIKQEDAKASRRHEYARLTLYAAAAVLIMSLGIVNHLDNKAAYLTRLNGELTGIEGQAKPLEDVEKRLRLLENRSQKMLSSLDVLYGLSKAMPQGTLLVSVTYEQNSQVAIRGQADGLSQVFEFVSQLEASKQFKDFSPKVRYATQKKTQAGPSVDFEITCLKKK